MRESIECIRKYCEFIETNIFAKHVKNFAEKTQYELHRAYSKNSYEPEIVKIIEKIVNQIDGLAISDRKFKISTNAIFIHGTKSQVEFKYYGNTTQRELGDLIFIISIIYNNKKYFEKFTITQFKRSSKKPTWYFNKKDKNAKYPEKEQLFLLSRFPTFKGTQGSIIPMKRYDIPNYFSCLGSHGLLYRPGDFTFASSILLEILLGDRKSIK
ncbi:MAG: hypothetical protein ACOC80_15465, partial [Petrotogales bacterium]